VFRRLDCVLFGLLSVVYVVFPACIFPCCRSLSVITKLRLIQHSSKLKGLGSTNKLKNIDPIGCRTEDVSIKDSHDV